MLDIKQIESFYPENLRPFKKNLLREYLQYKILETLFESEFGGKLIFMGGTAIHIIHGNARFSEDLDFDNRGLDKSGFVSLISKILVSLRRQGYQVEDRIVLRKTYKAYLKFSNLLWEHGISGHKFEKLNLQIDAEPQEFDYKPDVPILHKFDVFRKISVVPVDILLAQKLHCLFARPRLLGRDFYDAIFLLGKTKPNLNYLREKMGIESLRGLKSRLVERCGGIDFRPLAQDVEPFLYDPKGSEKVLYFPEYLKSIDF